MDQIATILMDVLAERADPFRLAADLIKRKAAERGLRLTKRHLALIEDGLRAEEIPDFAVRTPGEGPPRTFTIEFSESDLQEIESKVKAVVDQLPDLMDSLVDLVADDILATCRRTWSREVKRQQRELRRFNGALRGRWDGPLQLLAMLITIAREKGSEMNSLLREEASPEAPYTIEVLTRLHARSCQIACEVLTLLREGFADGALARWRTQHEISVVAKLIAEKGESAAERFLVHNAVESYKAAIQYQKYSSALGHDEFGADEMQRLKDAHDAALKRFGDAFRDDYAWAREYLNGKKPTFAALEESLQLDHMRPYYRLASQNVHPTPKGLCFALGLVDGEGPLLAGPSDVGFADPGRLSAVALVQVTTLLLGLKPTLDNAAVCRVLLALANETSEAFCAVEPWQDDSPGGGIQADGGTTPSAP
jgi:Family of unknown function (DUF5677)